MDLSRVYNTLDFVEANYNKQISIKELENVSCYSYRNIQRIFKYAFNETIGEYQKRLRLEKGYKRMLYTRENLTEIAFEVGFESMAAFSKALSENEISCNVVSAFYHDHIFVDKKDAKKAMEILNEFSE